MTRSPREVPAKLPEERPDPAVSSSRAARRSVLRDVRGDRRARWFKALAWGGFPGLFIGALIGVLEGPLAGIFAMAAITLGAGGFAILISETAGEAVRGVTNPRGRSRPGRHSGAEALVMRGEPEAAISVLRASLEEYPDDGQAMMKIAHILRNEVGDARRAIVAYRHARMSGALSEGQMRLAIREMLELARGIDYLHLVVADLEEHRGRREGTSEEAWASRQLAELTPPDGASAS